MKALVLAATLFAIPAASANRSEGTDGPQVVRSVLSFPMCVFLPNKMNDPSNWTHQPPCKPTDFGYLDEHTHLHFTTSMPQLEKLMTEMLKRIAGLPMDLSVVDRRESPLPPEGDRP